MRRAICSAAILLALAACSGAHPLMPPVAGPGGSIDHYVLQNGGSPQNWTTFSPAGSGGLFSDGVVGPDKNLWFTDANNERINRITMTGSVKFFAPSVVAFYLTVGADKKFYVTNGDNDQIGTMTTTGVTKSFTTPSGDHPTGLTLGPDNNVWFVEFNHVAKITKTGVITEYTLPSTGIGGSTITTGPDGNLWFTEYTTSKIGKVTTSGAVTEYPISGGCSPGGIVKGPDGNLWFRCGANIGRITTGGTVTLVPTTTSGNTNIEDMIVGPDGDPWFMDNDTGIHEINPNTLAITDYTPPNTGFNNTTLVMGPDGNVWVGAYRDVINVYIPNPLGVSPKSIAFTGDGQLKTLTVTENGTHAWTATSSNTAVATVAQGGQANKFTVTSVATGKATITISDAVGNLFKVKVKVP
jgi:streptogramin lyase